MGFASTWQPRGRGFLRLRMGGGGCQFCRDGSGGYFIAVEIEMKDIYFWIRGGGYQ